MLLYDKPLTQYFFLAALNAPVSDTERRGCRVITVMSASGRFPPVGRTANEPMRTLKKVLERKGTD